MRRSLFLIFIVLLLTSCFPIPFSARADELTDLQKQLDQLHQDLNAKQGKAGNRRATLYSKLKVNNAAYIVGVDVPAYLN